MHLLCDANDIFQDKFLENVMDDDNKMDENIENIMLLATGSLEKDFIIVIM